MCTIPVKPMGRSNLVSSARVRWASRYPSRSCVFGLLAASLSITSLAQSFDSQIAQNEATKRAESTLLAQELLKKGDIFYQEADYSKAVEKYSQAFAMLSDGAINASLKEAAVDRYAQAAVEESKQLSRFGQYAEARSLLKAVLAPNVAPNHSVAKQRLAQLDDSIRTNPVLTAEHLRNTESVVHWLRKAEGYYNLGQYDEAHLAYEEVLLVDRHNTAARRGMERVAMAKADYARSAYDQTRSAAMAQVASEWEMKVNPPTAQFKEIKTIVDEEKRIQEVYANQLRRIIVPIVDLQDLSIQEALDMARIWSKEYDTEALDPERRGVNFVLNIGDESSEWAKQIREKRVNLNVRNMPLDKVLDLICQATSTQWRHDQHAVIVTPSGAADTAIYRRTFRVPPTFMQDAARKAAESDDPFEEDTGSGSALSARASTKEYLEQLGVSFPDGASAKYIHGSGSLIVANTLQNLDLVEQYVRQYSQTENVQVVLKLTIVDVLKSDVKELGFDWLFADGSKDFSIGGGSQGNGNFIFERGEAYPKGYNPVTSGLRSGDSMFDTNFMGRVLNDDLLRPESATARAPGIVRLTTKDVAVILRGLDQKKNSDRIDTPTIIARSGEKATLFTGREMWVPTEYEPPEIPNSVNSTGPPPITPATPSAFEQRLVGLTLESECTISEDRQSIDVRIDAEMNNFDGFVNYGSPVTDPTVNPVTGDINSVVLTANAILMPIFRPIRLNTAVTVQDGSSFVIAGLNQNSIVTVEDKVPILGDVPLVGRFFKSEGIEKSDRAMLIFVNVELKDPTGRNWKDR